MKQYKELHLKKFNDTDEFEFVSIDQVEQFVPDIEELYKPIELNSLSIANIPSVFKGYRFDIPIYVNMKYVTIFELITENGWRYGNTYWMNDHKVLTFIK